MRNIREVVRNFGLPQTAMTAAIMVFAYISPAAAQQGICALPGGDSLLPLVGTVIQGVLVVGGVYLLAKGAGSTFGAGRGAGGRKNLLIGILVVMFGLLLPEIIQFFAQETGNSLESAGVGCMFGGG
jgi:hypothetical protein